jgi:hypothetical protein
MRGKDDRHNVRDPLEGGDGVCQERTIDQRGAVQRDEEVVAGRHPELRGDLEPLELRTHRDQRVDHRVPDRADPRTGAALAQQVLQRLRGVGEQEVRHVIGDDPVDLLGHRSIERSESCFDVADRNADLCGHNRGRRRRVDVARDEDEIGLLGLEDGLEALHDARHLRGMGPRADPEHVIWLAHA